MHACHSASAVCRPAGQQRRPSGEIGSVQRSIYSWVKYDPTDMKGLMSSGENLIGNMFHLSEETGMGRFRLHQLLYFRRIEIDVSNQFRLLLRRWLFLARVGRRLSFRFYKIHKAVIFYSIIELWRKDPDDANVNYYVNSLLINGLGPNYINLNIYIKYTVAQN